MKIKTILGIIFVLAFLAGCTGPIYTGDQCVDDGVCTLREKYLGNCFDCFPDFEVTEEQAFAYLDGNNLHANVCVRNKVNEYKGDVKVTWGLRTISGTEIFNVDEYAYFDSDDAWGYFSLNVDPGKINFHTFLEIGQNEQWQCFRRNFEVDHSNQYEIMFYFNSDKEVDEQDYFNNRISFIVEGELDLSEYLILDNIGFFRLVYSNVDTVEDFISNNYYKFNSYEAHYRNRDSNSVDVMVAADFESGDAYSLLFDVLELFESEEDYYFNETNVNNGVVYIGQNDQMAMWFYANRLIMVHSENILENDVFLEYINKFPSEMEYIYYECEDLDCPEGYFSEIIGYDEFNCPIFDCVEELPFQNASFFIVAVYDNSSSNDTILATQVLNEFASQGYFGMQFKLFSEIDALDLDYKLTLAIYDFEAKIIVGENSPGEYVIFGTKVINYLIDLGIEFNPEDFITNAEVNSSDLIDLFI